MIFLIEYNPRKGAIVFYLEFESSEREMAANTRLARELDLNRKGLDHEVVLLEAESEEALRRTHRRYFQTARQIAKSSSGKGTQ